MTTIELFWFLLNNLIFHPRCANKIVVKLAGCKRPELVNVDVAIRIKNSNHIQELELGETLCDGDEDYYKNVIVLG